MASNDCGFEGDNSGQQPVGAAVRISEKVTSVLEETVVTTDNPVGPMDISMLNDYVMVHLFGYLPMADLKNCRLVNRSWNQISNQAILKRDYEINLPKYGRAVENGTDGIPKLVQLIRTSFQFPWTKFKVQASIMKSAEEQRQLATLLRVISSFVTEIEIHDLQNLESVEYPNLRKLNLFYHTPNKAPKGCSRKSLLRLVELASKLNDITINGELNTPMFMELLEIPNCRKITRLSLHWWIEGRHLLRLSEMGFQLKFLNLAFNLTQIPAENLKGLLQSQSACLEELALVCGQVYLNEDDDDEVDPRRQLGLECPRLDKLKMLRVYSTNLYSRISYKDMFPALESLDFWANDPNPVNSFFNDNIEPVETVKYARFGITQWDPEMILQAARQFPKLRSIFLVVSRNVLNIVGLAMPQLEELELLFNDYDEHNMDAILTGLSTQEVEALKGLPTSQLDVLERNKQPVHFLKNLKKLRICRWERTEESLLTDFGCLFALLKMEHLEVLEIKGNCSRISEQVMERMRNKFVVRMEN